MPEPPDPKRPVPPGKPGSPLPRLWKTSQPEDDEPPNAKPGNAPKGKAEDVADGSVAPKNKKAPADPPGEKKGVLKEETPNLDTYETRQRVRLVVGSVLVSVALVGSLILYRVLAPPRPPEENPEDFAVSVPNPSGDPRERAEQEARVLFERSREVARNGNDTLAQAMLKRVSTAYPSTQVAIEAKDALARTGQGLPLFLDRPAVVASAGGASPPPAGESEKPKGPVVEASPTQPRRATGEVAQLQLPANAPEPPAPATTPATAPAPPAPETPPGRPLPKGFYARPRARLHESGWPLEILGERDGAPMVLVAGGTFLQGRDGGDPSEAPAHPVRLSTYYIDQHEVTVRQFLVFQKEAGRRLERVRALSRDGAPPNVDAEENRPVVMVTAREASDYAAWAGKRLPTEAQWEAAGRTPDGRLYPWGPESIPPRTDRQIEAVMAFKSDVTPYGAFDLAGNAWEWTKDWYDPRYYHLFRATPAENPTGPATRPRSQQLVVKGSSADWALSKREGLRVDVRLPYLGFRCVLPVEGPGNAFEPAPHAPTNAPAAPGGTVVPF